ncbi:hypothetical protein ACQXVK_07565 [Curtobacterium sp. AB451]|uniref:hypothetical protein n=1 Tax=Curtobacterium sp. AB451 TaxID=3422306 RepID=UPI003D34F553
MTSLSSSEHSGSDDLRWVVMDAQTWEARWGSEVIGTVLLGSSYEVRAQFGGLGGSHTSLESAKAQLEAWVRWQSGPPGAL